MKKCPFCFEEIQDAAVYCKYCNSDLTPKPTQGETGKRRLFQSSPAEQSGLAGNLTPVLIPTPLLTFEEFMRSYGNGWVLINKTDKLLTYQKNVPAQQGSCLVAFFLLWLFVLPAILYMIYGRSPAKTHQLTVTVNPLGSLTATADEEGLKVYNKFVNSLPRNLVPAAGIR